MKLDQLRKVIREEVKTAIKEELQEIMNEAVRVASTPVEHTQQTVYEHNVGIPTTDIAAPSPGVTSTDPITEMLNQTRATMTSEDYRTATSATSDMVSKPNFASMMAHNMGMNEGTGPLPGIDISQLDFVKKAGAIYSKSVENDKQKHGI
jgi:hypothetical protein